MVVPKFLRCILSLIFCHFFDFSTEMSTAERFPNGSYCTAKAIHVLHLSECARRYGSEKKSKMLNGEVLAMTNKRTITGR